jgi:predicted MFS family arabinose efflux permease
LITASYGKDQWGKSIAVFDTAAPGGHFLAPLLAVAVLSAFSWRYVFWAMAILSLVVFVMFVRTAPNEEPLVEAPRGGILEVMKNRSLMTLAWIWLLAAAGALGLGFILPVYLVKERGMDLTWANQVFAAGRGAGMLAVIAAGFLADRFLCRTLMGWVLAISGVCLLGVALWPENVGLGVWVFLESCVIMMFFPVSLIFIARVTAAGIRGTATGFVIGIGAGLGFGITPWILGTVADAWSFRVGIAVLGFIILLSSLAVRRIERF